MSEEQTQENVVSEVTVEPAPVPEPIAEPKIPEPIPTAQPVEPLNPEPIPEPRLASESVSEPSASTTETTQAPEPAVESEPQPVLQPISAPEPQVVASVSLVSRARELLIKARGAIQFKKRKKLEKIMGLFLKKQSITNDDVQKLLYVSDATATRYLRQLETEGKVRRQGVPGHASYSRI